MFIYKMNVYSNRQSVKLWETVVEWNDVWR